MKAEIEENFERSQESFWNELETIIAETDELVGKARCERNQQLARANGTQLEYTTAFLNEDILTKISKKDTFSDSISQLRSGAYLVSMNLRRSDVGHAIAFIKSPEGDSYLYDSNVATVRFEKSDGFIDALWTTVNQRYKSSFVTISRCWK